MEEVKCPNCETDNKTNSKYCSNCGFELLKSKPENLMEDAPHKQKDNNNKRKYSLPIVIGVVIFLIFIYLCKQLILKPTSIVAGSIFLIFMTILCFALAFYTLFKNEDAANFYLSTKRNKNVYAWDLRNPEYRKKIFFIAKSYGISCILIGLAFIVGLILLMYKG